MLCEEKVGKDRKGINGNALSAVKQEGLQRGHNNWSTIVMGSLISSRILRLSHN